MRMALVVSFIAGGLAALALAPLALRAEKPSGCERWQTAVGIDVPIEPEKLTEVPAYGSVKPRTAPAGWEPFAIAATGQIAFRRCAP
jgi:hypothetical protein